VKAEEALKMMHMPWVLVVIMAFILVVGGGVFLAVRVMGARSVDQDHPAPEPERP